MSKELETRIATLLVAIEAKDDYIQHTLEITTYSKPVFDLLNRAAAISPSAELLEARDRKRDAKLLREVASKGIGFWTSPKEELIEIAAARETGEWEPELGEVTKQAEPVFVVFDGPPDHNAPRFVEVETAGGISVKAGEWKPYGDYWTLGPLFLHPSPEDVAALKAENERLRAVLGSVNSEIYATCNHTLESERYFRIRTAICEALSTPQPPV